jgi:hypothetical protein
LRNEYIFCCCKTKFYTKYSDLLEGVDAQVEEDSDLLNIMRKNKITGMALASLLSIQVLKTLAHIAKSRTHVEEDDKL